MSSAAATSTPSDISPAEQRRLNELVATVALVFSLSDDEIDQLAEAIHAARITSLSAAYDEAAQIVDANADPYAPDDEDDEDQRGAAALSAAGIANTYHSDLANQIAQQVAQMAPSLLEHSAGEAEGALATGVASWAQQRAAWKARQIANAEAGAGAEAGTTRAVDGMLSGDLLGNLADMGLGPDDVLVAILPDYSSPDGICGEFAGQTFPLDMYYDLPDYPAHANCIHEKVILLRGQELSDVDPEGLTREELETEAQLAEQARLDAMTTATRETTGDEARIVAEQTAREGPQALLNLVGPTPEAGTLRKFDLRLPDVRELERLAKQQESLFGKGFGERAKSTKAHVVKAISKRLEGNAAWAHAVEALKAKDSEALVNKLVQQWAIGGTGPLIVAMQQAVRDEFALADAAFSYTKAQVKAAARKFGADEEIQAAFRAFARATYENTKAWLDEHGIEEVVMYRGMVWDAAKAPEGVAALARDEAIVRRDLALNPISSFAGNLKEAKAFAYGQAEGVGMVVAVRVPRERILSSALAGIGAKAELEYTVLGGREEVLAYAQRSMNEFNQFRFVDVDYADFARAAEGERAAGEAVPEVALDLKRPGIDPRDVRDLSDTALGHLSDLQRMTTSKQVVAWLHDEFWQSGIDLPAAVNVRTLKELGAELVRLRDLYPDAFRDLHYVSVSSRPQAKKYLKALMPETKGVLPNGWMGGTFRLADAETQAPFGSGMIFNARLMTDRTAYDAFAENAVRTGFWQEGATDFGYVLRHEFGHVLQAVLSGDESVSPLVLRGVKHTIEVKAAYAALMRDAADYASGLRGFQETVLSTYGRADANELFAEAFAASRYGSADASTLDYVQRQQAILDTMRGVPGAAERLVAIEAEHATPNALDIAVGPRAPPVGEAEAGTAAETDLKARLANADTAQADALLHDRFPNVEFNFAAPDPFAETWEKLARENPDEPEFQVKRNVVMAPEIARDVADAFLRLASEYPEVVGQLEYVGLVDNAHVQLLRDLGMSGGGMVEAQEEGRALVFGPQWRNEASLAAAFSQNLGYTLEGGNSPLVVMRHEFGHLVQAAIERMPAEQRAAYEAWRAKYPYERSLVSQYARKTEHEQFAEAFTALHDGVPSVRALPEVRELGQVLHDLFPDAPVKDAPPALRDGATTVVVREQDRLALATVLGRSDLSADELAGMVGARSGDTVTVAHAGDTTYLTLQGPRLATDSVTPAYTAQRTLERDADGRLFVFNRGFEVDASRQGEGIGTAVFAEQVRTLDRLGVSYIETDAGGSAAAHSAYNGYYTWPRLGYDGDIPDAVRAKLPVEFTTATRLSDLMATPEGAAWWKANGQSVQVRFDLTPGSQSRRVLDAYLDEKGIAPAAGEVSAAEAPKIQNIAGPSETESEQPLPDLTLKALPDERADAIMDRVNDDIQLDGDRGMAKDATVNLLLDRLVDDPDFQQVMASYARVGASQYDTVNRLVATWAGSSNDGDLPKALQMAAQREFSLNPATVWYDEYDQQRALRAFGDELPGLQTFLRAQYEATQDWFRERGITHVRVYRGASWDVRELAPSALGFDGGATTAEIGLSPMSSFSTVPAVAYSFTTAIGGNVGGNYRALLSADVPAERVLSTPRTGFGALSESEIVVLGSPAGSDAVVAYSWNNAATPYPDYREVERAIEAARDDAAATPAATASPTAPEEPTRPKMQNLMGPSEEVSAEDVTTITVEQLAREEATLSRDFDVTNRKESDRKTKKRIQQAIHQRLKDNEAWQRLADASYQPWMKDYKQTAEERSLQLVRDNISSWAETSTKTIRAGVLQLAVESEFGVAEAAVDHIEWYASDTVRQAYQNFAGAYNAFVRAMYEETQDFLREKGITEVTLYRGLHFGETPPDGLTFDGQARTAQVRMQPISSYSFKEDIASSFALYAGGEEEKVAAHAAIVIERVPAAQIFATAQTGFGCKNEAEFVIFGGVHDAVVIAGTGEQINALTGAVAAGVTDDTFSLMIVPENATAGDEAEESVKTIASRLLPTLARTADTSE